jgi:hypothetical protein
MSKIKLTTCVLCKSEVHAKTVTSIYTSLNHSLIKDLFTVFNNICVGQSDLPKARSIHLNNWYEKGKSGDLFLYIDADQTFIAEDILTSYLYISQGNDVVCGSYARKSGGITVQPEFPVQFYIDKKGPLLYGSTGFMMIKWDVLDKLAKSMKKAFVSRDAKVYPFFLERIIEDQTIGVQDYWLSEDYSFTWCIRNIGGKVYGYISPTIGHLIVEEKFVDIPSMNIWSHNSIVIHCNYSPDVWNPDKLKSGLGGSETAVIKLSEIWAKNGYDVTVFCNCGEEKVYDNVNYRKISSFNSYDIYNILIVWRDLRILSTTDIRAKKRIIDIHDLIKPELIIPRLISYTDLFMCKSKYHSSLLPGVEERKIKVIPNGGYVKSDIPKKDPFYIIYTSSYDRGLYYMLRYSWHKIKKACPEAYLKVYYGWDTFNRLINNDEKTRDYKLEYKRQMEFLMNQEGVMDCGRISGEELMKEREKANIHWYVGDFQEIDCISIRESASVGAIPIVSNYAEVFREKDYCIKIEGDPKTEECQDIGAAMIISLIKNPQKADKIRGELVGKVPKETWENIGLRWIKEVFE